MNNMDSDLQVRWWNLEAQLVERFNKKPDMETILSTTVSELTRAVGANSARIKVGVNTPAKDQKKRAPHD